MAIHSSDFIGLFGVTITLIAYFLLQIDVIKSNGFSYSFVNMVGSTLILLSILKDWNLSAAVMEVCWILVSVYGCVKYFMRQKQI